MMKVLFPIHIDRWRSPIASLLREIAIRVPDFKFYSFSKPETIEDRKLGEIFWKLNHVTKLHTPLEIAVHKFDIVHHASATLRNFIAARLAKAKGAIHIFTANIEPHCDDKYLNWYIRSVKSCDVLVAVSKAVSKSLESWFGRKADAVIPNGVDIEFFSPSNASLHTINYLGIKKPYFLFCAVLTHRKRPDIFLELAKRIPKVNFIMVGGYYDKKEAEQYLEMARSLKNVIYLGRQNREIVRDLMAGAEALIFPSEIEGLPLTVCEALSMGLPVLAQPKSSLPEVVFHGKTGWLLNGDSLDEWECILYEILNWDKQKKSKFKKEAREFVQTYYSWDIIAAQYRDLYLKIVG